ncbi:cytidine 5'-phosphate N-acetylneuraminic acid synthetase [Desulfovibrio sp. An276]|uniref:glycosyltransferase n=1 Tax=Desulfovibrio sp. An276 TaxID=1965618 RepID=UPI000B39290A|nr:glycosyltransferase [Desulfovibrio sp. An276]OUO50254.1 cytidine 5'-phosphate N-acetylneuraminic acid synthetase [Desulfovibrio sp. An276]
MRKRCIVIPAIKKNAVIPDQLVKKLAGVTLIERGINTARGVVGGEDIYVLTDSQEISLICERAGVQFRRNKDLHFRTLNIVAEMRDVLGELAQKYEHCIVLRASCPLITWVDVEDAWHKYLATDCDSLVTVKSVHQRVWSVQGQNLEQLLDEEVGQFEVVVESRALIILRSKALLKALSEGYAAHMDNVVPYFLNDRAIEIQSYQDWWICEHLLRRRHIVFVVAGWPAIGMGHIYRALMLAHEIVDHKISFVCTRESELAVQSIAERDYHSTRQGEEKLEDTVLKLRPDLVVNDILNTDAEYMGALAKAGVRTVNFEDEGEGADLADLVINAVYDVSSSSEKRLCGPAWFCLRDEFVNATRNVFREDVKTVLITFGGTDQRNFTRRVFEVIEPICKERGIAIRIVAGPGYMHRYEMERRVKEASETNSLISFTWATNVMSRMMEGADLCICSAGRTTYELAHMRVPAIVLATHEREAKHSFARPRYGFVFLGLMDRVTDQQITRAFSAMLGNRLRKLFFDRMAAQDFTPNKDKVIHRILGLLPEGTESEKAREEA